MPRYAAVLMALPLLAALAACVDPAPGLPPAPPTDEACGAPTLQWLVGQDRKVLETMKFAQPTRVIEPGMAVTMDYNPARLNIWLNEAGRIDKVTCG